MISTDKAVNPTSVMGSTKHLAERFVNTFSNVSDTSFVVVRFGKRAGLQRQRGANLLRTNPPWRADHRYTPRY